MNGARVVDVSTISEIGFGRKSTGWWGTVGFIAIEGTSLALCAATWFYLSKNSQEWPPAGTPNPDLLLPTLSMLVLIAHVIPARIVDVAAKQHDYGKAGSVLLIWFGIEVLATVLRAFEFLAVNVRWDDNAYGSIVWFTLGLHTTLLLTDVVETGVMAAIFKTGRAEEKHLAHASDLSFYGYFLSVSWVLLWMMLYLGPRLL